MCNFCSDRSYDFPMGMFFSAHHSFCKASTKTLGGQTGWREVRPQQEKHLSAFDIALNSFLGFFPPTSLINLQFTALAITESPIGVSGRRVFVR